MFNESGGTEEDRVAEAHKIVSMLADLTEQMKLNEAAFVEQMDDCRSCSPKQLFWLRDLKDKYL